MDLIERQEALNIRFSDAINENGVLYVPLRDFTDGLKALPSAEPERETAKFVRWMECKKTVNYISYTPHCKCSKCGTEFIIDTIKYCYMCGARMER